MKPLPIYQPRQIGSVYLLLIPIFGILYWLNPTFWPEPLTFIQSIYFSVITITTLGYGDISPVTETARLISAVEALSGIVLIGLF
ncbi:MAG: two pore domain potassium channel family protein [Proteobacteria bacterium]|nr:two pore domain potassium channel family protein [Pseudomonadota bacterium]